MHRNHGVLRCLNFRLLSSCTALLEKQKIARTKNRDNGSSDDAESRKLPCITISSRENHILHGRGWDSFSGDTSSAGPATGISKSNFRREVSGRDHAPHRYYYGKEVVSRVSWTRTNCTAFIIKSVIVSWKLSVQLSTRYQHRLAMLQYICTTESKLQCIDNTENTTSIKRVIGVRSFLRCAMVW